LFAIILIILFILFIRYWIYKNRYFNAFFLIIEIPYFFLVFDVFFRFTNEVVNRNYFYVVKGFIAFVIVCIPALIYLALEKKIGDSNNLWLHSQYKNLNITGTKFLLNGSFKMNSLMYTTDNRIYIYNEFNKVICEINKNEILGSKIDTLTSSTSKRVKPIFGSVRYDKEVKVISLNFVLMTTGCIYTIQYRPVERHISSSEVRNTLNKMESLHMLLN
jgi:hypothetical protein